MIESDIKDLPEKYIQLEQLCEELGFTMPSDRYIGTLLKTLVRSKPGAQVLELGTGISLTLAWLIDGLDENGHLVTIDNDPKLIQIAEQYFGEDPRVDIICADGTEWLHKNANAKFDLIFADAWPGKYNELEEVLAMLNKGAFYVIDDMLPQPNWPEGHDQKAIKLIATLEKRNDLALTKMNWSTGVIIATKL